MPIYVLLSKLTDSGAQTLKEKPSRILEVNKEIEILGAKVLAQYATLGEYDFVTIVEAPDNVAISRVSVELGARGSIRMQTLAAIPIEEFVNELNHRYM
jgi:uncharacterized protein with GYD domain